MKAVAPLRPGSPSVLPAGRLSGVYARSQSPALPTVDLSAFERVLARHGAAELEGRVLELAHRAPHDLGAIEAAAHHGDVAWLCDRATALRTSAERLELDELCACLDACIAYARSGRRAPVTRLRIVVERALELLDDASMLMLGRIAC